MRRPRYSFLPEKIVYDGTQLRPHWIYRRTGFIGDAVVAFVGGCRVEGKGLVDVRDACSGRVIAAQSMLHFIAEHFTTSIYEVVLLQRLLVFCCLEALHSAGVAGLRRDGDDIYVGSGKLSVSVATLTPVSALIHLGLNIDKTGCPVRAASLSELKVSPSTLAKQVLKRYVDEVSSVLDAAFTVSPVI